MSERHEQLRVFTEEGEYRPDDFDLLCVFDEVDGMIRAAEILEAGGYIVPFVTGIYDLPALYISPIDNATPCDFYLLDQYIRERNEGYLIVDEDGLVSFVRHQVA